jgi:hypothetical protein
MSDLTFVSSKLENPAGANFLAQVRVLLRRDITSVIKNKKALIARVT